MDYTSHIPTELIQVFSARQANDNLLVPYGLRNGILLCFGETGRDYSGVIEEQAVLYDRAVEVTSIESGALRELLLQRHLEKDTKILSKYIILMQNMVIIRLLMLI
mgnify:CR=1 FL=1